MEYNLETLRRRTNAWKVRTKLAILCALWPDLPFPLPFRARVIVTPTARGLAINGAINSRVPHYCRNTRYPVFSIATPENRAIRVGIFLRPSSASVPTSIVYGKLIRRTKTTHYNSVFRMRTVHLRGGSSFIGVIGKRYKILNRLLRMISSFRGTER